MLPYTPEQMMECVEETDFITVLTGMGVVPSIRIPVWNSFLNESIDSLPLERRAWNCLMQNRIYTLGDVANLIKCHAFADIRNCGEKTAKQIIECFLVTAYERLEKDEKLRFWKHFLENSKPKSERSHWYISHIKKKP
jgi:hypothetical protein